MIIKRLVLFVLRFYRHWISPGFPPSCRFYPTCSTYSIQVIDKYGLVHGSLLAFKRLVQCHPLNPGGYDPIP